jgi:hypothetical protein
VTGHIDKGNQNHLKGIVQATLDLSILSQPPKCWDYRHMPPSLAGKINLLINHACLED